MGSVYEIYLNNKSVGQAQVEKMGLYYRFLCRCRLPQGKIYRIWVSCGGKEESLGIPVPKGNVFILETRLPVSRMGKGDFSFRAADKEAGGRFYPVSPERPFPCMLRLREGQWRKEKGVVGIYIPEKK